MRKSAKSAPAELDPATYDLSRLPDGFRRAVVKEWSRSSPTFFGLALAIGAAWRGSTARQRSAAELGVASVLRAVITKLSRWDASLVVGIIAASCLDLEMSICFQASKIDPRGVLRGIDMADGIRANVAVADLLDSLLGTMGPSRP
jgi:hypothetical protein